MGVLIDGKWTDGELPQETSAAGQFKRADSMFRGRITADGSRIIGWGQSEPGGSQLLFTEVDAKGKDLLDLVCPDGSSSYRAVKVPLSAFDLTTLRTTAGHP